MVQLTILVTLSVFRYLMQLLTSGFGTTSALHIACWEGSIDAVVALTSGSSKMAKDYINPHHGASRMLLLLW